MSQGPGGEAGEEVTHAEGWGHTVMKKIIRAQVIGTIQVMPAQHRHTTSPHAHASNRVLHP